MVNEHFLCPYHLYLLVVRSMSSARREGEGVTGATPLFCASLGAPPPFQLTLRVSSASLPRGVAPVSIIPAGRLGFRRADPT